MYVSPSSYIYLLSPDYNHTINTPELRNTKVATAQVRPEVVTTREEPLWPPATEEVAERAEPVPVETPPDVPDGMDTADDLELLVLPEPVLLGVEASACVAAAGVGVEKVADKALKLELAASESVSLIVKVVVVVIVVYVLSVKVDAATALYVQYQE